MPFGMGVRTCIGQQFALMEAKAWIAATYDHFSFKLPQGFTFMPSHREGGASPNLQGLELQVFPAPGAPTASAVARVPAFFSKGSAAAAAAGGGGNGHRRSSSLSRLHAAAEAACPAAAAGGYVPSPLSQEAAADVSAAAALQGANGSHTALSNGASPATPAASAQQAAAAAAGGDDDQRHGTPLVVLYGSNAGTCESFADLLVEQAGRAGFAATAASLDSIISPSNSSSSSSGTAAGGLTARLPQAGALVVITSTYNGYPPDNALQFARWLDAAAAAVQGQGNGCAGAAGLRYAVFGVGSSQWETFHAFPK
jgi:hypothetical protein